MMRSGTKWVVGSMLSCFVGLAVAGFGIKAGGQSTEESKVEVPPEQVIASIRTAIAAKPGNVRAVEAENEGGMITCEVKILAEDGKTYEVEVDVATNTVIEVEADDEPGEDDDDKD